MEAIKDFFPHFVPNQLLTDSQLNDLRDYLDRQERLTRIRIAGIGIVCGLHWEIVAGPHLVIHPGFGITSDGYLLEIDADLTSRTYTHYRTYRDPDVDEDRKTPQYRNWRKSGDFKGQADIIELLHQKAMSVQPAPEADPIDTQAQKDRVLVLYLERNPVDLNSCLVTDCNNKGRKIEFNVRALLFPKDTLNKIQDSPRELKLSHIPRLHTKMPLDALAKITDVSELNEAYRAIVSENMGPLFSNIVSLFENYGKFLNINLNAHEVLDLLRKRIEEIWKSTGCNQYHYDLLKDLSCAYNEALTAACTLIPGCFPGNDFPRHLMLGAMDRTPRYRNEFLSSPVRNVIQGDLERVRKLFERIVAMAEGFDPDLPKEIRLTPSHTELHPLGARALPFYYKPGDQEDPKSLQSLWQPRLPCTTEELRSYHSKEEKTGFDYLYNQSSFIRIEGHLGRESKAAYEEIANLRRKTNVEFEVIETFLQDPDSDHQERAEELKQFENQRAEQIDELRKALSEIDKKKQAKTRRKDIQEIFKQIAEGKKDLTESSRRWAQRRSGRKLYCDTSHLEADYLELRTGLLCAFHELLGHLVKLTAATEVNRDLLTTDEAKKRLSYFKNQLQRLAEERLLKEIISTTERNQLPQDPLTFIKEWRDGKADLFQLFAKSLKDAEAGIEGFIGSYLHLRLSEIEQTPLIRDYKEVVSDLVEVLLLSHMVEYAVTGGTPKDLPPDARSPGGVEWRHAIDSLLRMLGCCLHAHLSAVFYQYDYARKTDISLFRNLVQAVDGIEHTSGVNKGGTYILLCDSPNQESKPIVVGDLSLAGRPPCCCHYDAQKIPLPLVALPDYRVIFLEPKPDTHDKEFYEVSAKIPILSNDYDPNVFDSKAHVRNNMKVTIPGNQADMQGSVKLEDGIIHYFLKDPKPGKTDRFKYHIESVFGTFPGDTADVMILFLHQPKPANQPGAITGYVYYDPRIPAEGVKVFIPNTTWEATIAKDGSFTISGLPEGDHNVRVDVKGYGHEAIIASVKWGQPSKPLEIILRKCGSIEGTVKYKDDGPVDSAQVRVSDANYTTTDAKGHFWIRDLVKGTYKIRVNKLGSKPAVIDGIEVSWDNTTIVPRDIELVRDLGRVMGSVRFENLYPAKFVDVVIGEGHKTRTYDSGKFDLADIPEGTWDVTVTIEGFTHYDTSVDVFSGLTTKCSPLTLYKLPALEVRVVSLPHLPNSSPPIQDVSVTITNKASGWYKRSSTDDQGRVIFSLTPGAYTIALRKKGYVNQDIPEVRVEQGQHFHEQYTLLHSNQ
ncbi:MAG: hypothetical protein CVU57_20870 [Deltaproteobacteria bacterium HGW-Deltaproteobacteria-15]|jgi:hypothetical protein|nr:MAG: hypothetical protein CVU57_20870 [Deltaproteobacteria bacterium HGW-Deltaproteobacteria-15]